MTQNIFLQDRRFQIYHGQKVLPKLFLPAQIEAWPALFAALAGVQTAAYCIIEAQQRKNNAGLKPALSAGIVPTRFSPLLFFL